MVVVADPTPTTAGMPNSRATIAQWLSTPPVSTTTAAALAKSGVQGGAVVSATSTSPGRSLAASASERITRAGARTRPGEPALPRRTPGSVGAAGGGPKNLPS